LKARYELYVFVKTFSGSGWDDHLKYATHTDEFVEEFCRVRGDKYEICFTTSCPWWDELDDLFTGAISKATGRMSRFWANASRNRSKLPHFPRPPHLLLPPLRHPQQPPAHAHDPGMPPSPRNMTPPSPARVPPGEFDDELAQVRRYCPSALIPLLTPYRFPRNHQSAGSGLSAKTTLPIPKIRRLPSQAWSYELRQCRRNAEAGSQIARSIDNLSAAVAQPIVTSEDPRYVDDVVRILQDKTLLPDNPPR
ncbi:hypothetical protein R3P38DRAFT_2527177, partial [Favolaschia claudopus]